MPFWHTVVVVDTCNNGTFDLVFMESLKNAYNNSFLDITLGTVGSENHFELYHRFKRPYEIKNGGTYGCLRQPFQNGSLWKSGNWWNCTGPNLDSVLTNMWPSTGTTAKMLG